MLRPGAPHSVALSPPLILNENHIDQIITILRDYLKNL
jgi:adenosylmethionine-8-amino-7-oxononanoate aminotransferase